MAQTHSKTPRHVSAENLAVTVAQAGNTTLLEVDVHDIASLGVSVAVTGKLLDAFIVQGRMSKNDTYQTLYSAAGDYTSPAGAVIDASGDLTTIAAAGTGWLMLNTLGLYGVKILTSSGDAAGSTVSAYAIGKG